MFVLCCPAERERRRGWPRGRDQQTPRWRGGDHQPQRQHSGQSQEGETLRRGLRQPYDGEACGWGSLRMVRRGWGSLRIVRRGWGSLRRCDWGCGSLIKVRQGWRQPYESVAGVRAVFWKSDGGWRSLMKVRQPLPMMNTITYCRPRGSGWFIGDGWVC